MGRPMNGCEKSGLGRKCTFPWEKPVCDGNKKGVEYGSGIPAAPTIF